MLWNIYEKDILRFCEACLCWKPSDEARKILLDAQRGYPRLGIVGRTEAWKALAAVNIWTACVFPERLQLVVAGTTKAGRNWLKYLRDIRSQSHLVVREELLFCDDDTSVFSSTQDTPSISVMTADMLNAIQTRLVPGRTTLLVMPDFDRVPTRWYGSIQALVSGPNDQWITIAVPPK